MQKNTSADTQETPSPAIFSAHPYKRPRILLQENEDEPLQLTRLSNRLGPTAEKRSLQRNPQQAPQEGGERQARIGVYDFPIGHREVHEIHPSSPHLTIVQRRGHPASGRVPTLQLSEHEGDIIPGLVAGEPLIQSAPPQQHQFTHETRLPPPSHLLVPSDKTHYDAQSWCTKPSYLPLSTPEMRYMPTSDRASRVCTSPTLPPRSPAYSCNVPLPYHRSSDAPRPVDTSHGTEALHTSPPNKGSFLSLFSSFYDSLSDSRALLMALEHQINASNTILQTLQRSKQVLEEIVEQRLLEQAHANESRFARLESRFSQLEKRHARLEARLKQPLEEKSDF
ncbi:Uncharacterized protein MSYG_0852 [Malassezia sympodialis ATCC 42132]|uniref:Uncharacterized protein n=1 Tax=Malassezia sympodialis (strain ATCC 42132) TaxID=1230383 RepID=A0A1M8A2W9_MALS4|nr:Uncharacterized protein MSYG_0852 [Malassezia sympodialis ATCC 42132]